MTILHVFSGDLWAGAERMIYALLKELRSHPNIQILALSLNESALSRALREAGIETIVIPEQTHSFARVILKAVQYLKNREIQIVHSHRYKENLLALIISRFIGAKCLVSTLHGLPEVPTPCQSLRKS